MTKHNRKTYQHSLIGAILLEVLKKFVECGRTVLGKSLAVHSAFAGFLAQLLLTLGWQWPGR